MKNQSASFGTQALTTCARYYSKFVVDGTEYTDTLDDFKMNSLENPDNDISIGNTCASGVSFSIISPSIAVMENKEVAIYEGLKINGSIEYAKLGIFKITKEESDGEKTNYIGYDRMYSKFEQAYFSELAYPSTDKAIIEELCSQVGISLATAITSAHTIATAPQGYTRREVLGYMSAMQGKNATINEDGNLELKWYTAINYSVDSSHLYFDDGATFTTSKNFIIGKLTCITGSGSDNTSITSGSGATGITFSNPFMTQAVLDEIYQKIGGFTFRSMNVKFVGDIRLEVGDIVSVVKDGVTYSVPIMQITHECDGGLISTVKSIGQSETQNQNVQGGPLTKAVERNYAELLLVKDLYANCITVDTANITYAKIVDLQAVTARIDTLETTSITSQYADLHYAKIDLANIADGAIKTAMIDTGAIKTAQIADGSITDGKIVNLTASKLTAGTIDASEIDVINMNCANLTVGKINGIQIANGAINSAKLESTLNQTIIGAKEDIDNLTIGGENKLIASKTLLNTKYFIADTLTYGNETLTCNSDRLVLKEVA